MLSVIISMGGAPNTVFLSHWLAIVSQQTYVESINI